MTEKKITKREMFEMIMEEVKGRPEMVEFCKHEIELLTKKSAGTSKREKARKEADVAIAEAILSALIEKKTVTEIIRTVPTLGDFSTQKIAPILATLVADGKMKREMEKGKALYSVVV